MGLVKRTIGSLRSGKTENVAMAMLTPQGTAAFPNLRYDAYVREGYQKNELVFACVEEWATDIAEAQLEVFHHGPDGPEAVENHHGLELLHHPNPYMSGDDFLGAIEMYKKLVGNAYELKVRSAGQKVVERWLLRPDRVKIIPSRTTYIDHYEYRIGAEKYDLDPADVVHHRTRNPYDDYYGQPPLMAASGSVDIFNFMKDMLKGFLQNSGMPAGILQVAGKVSEAEAALIRGKFRNEFGGAATGNIMISDGGSEAPKFTPLSMPLGTRGLIVPEMDEMDEARIAMVFRVPLSLVGARLAQTHSTLGQAGRQSDRQFFTEQELVPEWKAIASTQTMGYRDELLGPDEWVEFDLSTVKALTEDQNALHTRARSNVAGIILSVQEARQELGYDRDPNPEDIFLVPINVTPTTWADIVNPPEPEPMVPVQVPPDNPDQLPVVPPQKRLGQPLVVNVINQAGDARKVMEYDADGRVTERAIVE